MGLSLSKHRKSIQSLHDKDIRQEETTEQEICGHVVKHKAASEGVTSENVPKADPKTGTDAVEFEDHEKKEDMHHGSFLDSSIHQVISPDEVHHGTHVNPTESSEEGIISSSRQDRQQSLVKNKCAIQVQFSQEENKDVADQTIKQINQTQDKWLEINRNRPKHIEKGWNVVHLFVSSTFTDFHAEREILVKRVIPELNEWGKSRKIQVIECDLRWGIPKDTATEDTIEICLNEIERCQDETGGQAFFLNMLGERYGWIPDLTLISDDIISRYDLIEGISITHMEILHSALRSNSPNAVFLLRNSGFVSSLPENLKPTFIETTKVAKHQLVQLKEELRRGFPGQVFDYQATYDGIDSTSGIEKVSLSGLDTFALKVIEFFKEAIGKFYPQIEEDLTQDEWNSIFQDAFIEKKGALLIGREAEKEQILEFLSHSNSTESYLILVGQSGIGKSSLLANVVRELKSLSKNCIYNFASASPGSTMSNSVRDNFTKKLMAFGGMDQNGFDNKMYGERVKTFKEAIDRILETGQQMTLVFDAVNQFSNDEVATLDWLPRDLRGNIKCIIGCTEDSPLLHIIKGALPSQSCQIVHLRGFEGKEVEHYITARLAQYNKKLDGDQMKELVSANEACNPLWLALACEELRMFGVFERLTVKIKELSGTLKELVAAIIERIISEDGSNLMKDAVCLLVCSMSGLTEPELQWSLGTEEEPLPLMTWKKCRIILQPYLLIVGKRRGDENLAFFHDSFNVVVKERFLADDSIKQSYHSKLAESFSKFCSDDSRIADELPVQLKAAKEFQKLVDFFRKDPRSIRVNKVMKSYHLREFRCNTFIRGANDPFCAPVYVCNMCSVRMKAFTPIAGQNKDNCVICGSNVPFKNERSLAYVCMKHKKHTAPDTANCYVCKRVIFLKLKSGMPYSQLYTCHICSSQGQKCINLNC